MLKHKLKVKKTLSSMIFSFKETVEFGAPVALSKVCQLNLAIASNNNIQFSTVGDLKVHYKYYRKRNPHFVESLWNQKSNSIAKWTQEQKIEEGVRDTVIMSSMLMDSKYHEISISTKSWLLFSSVQGKYEEDYRKLSLREKQNSFECYFRINDIKHWYICIVCSCRNI